VLQSLGDRRGQLDQREESMDTQVQLIAAAEAKLDARIQEMTGLKTDIQGLLGQADQQQQAEADRLVRVYEDMDAKKAAAAMAILDDSVRLPIAAKMKERKLADILKNMAPQDAKILTEKLAQRMAGSKLLADAKTALNPPTAAAAAAAPTPTPAPPTAKAKPKANPAAPAPDQNAQVGQTGPAADADATPKPAKPHKVARAKPPHPKAKPVDADVADAMHPPGGTVEAAAKPAAKPVVKPPAKVASTSPAPISTLKPAVPPSAKPG
jgi:flagellar motility protein MotE (MotC chaperone)